LPCRLQNCEKNAITIIPEALENKTNADGSNGKAIFLSPLKTALFAGPRGVNATKIGRSRVNGNIFSSFRLPHPL